MYKHRHVLKYPCLSNVRARESDESLSKHVKAIQSQYLKAIQSQYRLKSKHQHPDAGMPI